jgi:hypothetical protein
MFFMQFFCRVLLVAFFLALSGCAAKYAPPRTAEDLSPETVRPEEQISDREAEAIRARTHLQLARHYVDHRNPNADYGRALQEFAAYLLLAPEGAENDEIQNWISTLREVEDRAKQNTKLQEQISALTEEMGAGRGVLEQQVKMNKKLREDVQKLQGNNMRLQETIKKLKNLDRQIEERRKSIQ